MMMMITLIIMIVIIRKKDKSNQIKTKQKEKRKKKTGITKVKQNQTNEINNIHDNKQQTTATKYVARQKWIKGMQKEV